MKKKVRKNIIFLLVKITLMILDDGQCNILLFHNIIITIITNYAVVVVEEVCINK